MDVAPANTKLAELGGENAVGQLLEIIAESGLEKEVGIRLLHKHNEISIDEFMLEVATFDVEGFALCTAPQPLSGVVSKVPNSWRLSGSGATPIEYSDPKLVNAAFNVSDHAGMFDRLSKRIADLGVTDLLGPCLVYSDDVYRHSVVDAPAFLEKTDEKNRANVVRIVAKDDAQFTNSAKTKWTANKIVDEAGNVSWMTACNCFCAISEEGGHQGTTYHQISLDRSGRV